MKEHNHVFITEDEANNMADRLTEYWHSQGYKNAMFWVKPESFKRFRGTGIDSTYVIRSNLIKGLPPKK